MGRNFAAVLIVLASVSSSGAVDRRELTGSQLQRYDRVTHALIAPCCWRESIAIHRSDEALQMLDEVERLVADGRSEEEIKAIYVARYGERILADPPGHMGLWLYVMPVALLGSFVSLAVLRLRSLVERAQATVPAQLAPPELIAQVRMETSDEWR